MKRNSWFFLMLLIIMTVIAAFSMSAAAASIKVLMEDGRFEKNKTVRFNGYDLDCDGQKDTITLEIWGENDASEGMGFYKSAQLSVNQSSQFYVLGNALLDISLQLITLDNGHRYLYLLGHQKGWNAPIPSEIYSYSNGSMVKKYDLSNSIKRKINGHETMESGEVVKVSKNKIYAAVSGDSKPAFYTLQEKNGRLVLKKGPSSVSLPKPKLTFRKISSPKKGTVKIQWSSNIGNWFLVETSYNKSFKKILSSIPISDLNQRSLTIKAKSGKKLYVRIKASKTYIFWGTDSAWKTRSVKVK